MGGSSGLILGNDIAMLEQRAKQELAKSKPNIFISFAHEDINLIQLFRGQSSNNRKEKTPCYSGLNCRYVHRSVI